MTPIALFLMCWAALTVAKGTQIGRSLHSVMVQQPLLRQTGLHEATSRLRSPFCC